MIPESLAFMRLALREAEKARGHCSPNPFVGAIIVKGGQIIARGHTQACGSDHAEIQALKVAGSKAAGADLYVTLEPCSHYGKTPPCALAIIKAGLKRVFVGIVDPNPQVSGRGIKMLREAGIEVSVGILEDEISLQLESHLCFMLKRRPFVTLKTALSLDGKYAAPDGSSRWITSEKSRRFTHRLRSQQDAILTGIKTVIDDDPMLNARLPGKIHQPLRVIIDPLLELPLSSQIAQSMHILPTLIICSPDLLESKQAQSIQALGATIITLPATDNYFCPGDILNLLYQRQIVAVLLETGSGLAESFWKAELVDKCLFFYGPLVIGGNHSPYPALGRENISEAITFTHTRIRRIGPDLLVTAYPKF